MSRLGDWWQARKAQRGPRVSSDAEVGPQKAVWWLLALFALAFALMILWAVFLGGRWAYREIRGNDAAPASESEDRKQEESSSADKEPSEQSSDNPQSTPNDPAQNEDEPTPTTPPQNAPVQPPQLPRSGPSEE